MLAYDGRSRLVVAVVKVTEGEGDRARHRLETWTFDAGRNTWTKADPPREPDPSGSRARMLAYVPDPALTVLENRTHPPQGPAEQQIWTYRPAGPGVDAPPAPEPPAAGPRDDGRRSRDADLDGLPRGGRRPAHNQLMRQREMADRKAEREATQLARQQAREQEQIKKAEFRAEEQAAKEHQKRMDKLGSGGPISFANELSENKLVNVGKQIGWVGRQLTYNFTLPLAAAGTMLFKFNQDITRSMTNMSKLYGQAGEDQDMLKAEVKALGRTFELLGTRFGVAQNEVIDIGAAWAAAGSEGAGLAKNVRATMETMILYEMDAAQATEALIAIQAQWQFSTEETNGQASELTTELAYLNAISNATAISAEGLIDVIQRAGGVARTSGMSLRELAAFAAALVPATGDAAQAGTAMRSIISSLVAPTQQAIDALGLMGITVTDKDWMGATATRKIQIMAEHFDKLSDAQKGVVSSTVATRWQVSRFDVLMRDVLDPLGNYHKALDATANVSDALKIRNKELMAVLDSSPKKWDIMVNATKNALGKSFKPMIPVIMTLIGWVTKLAIAFGNLSPELQKWILFALSAIAWAWPADGHARLGHAGDGNLPRRIQDAQRCDRQADREAHCSADREAEGTCYPVHRDVCQGGRRLRGRQLGDLRDHCGGHRDHRDRRPGSQDRLRRPHCRRHQVDWPVVRQDPWLPGRRSLLWPGWRRRSSRRS